MDWSELNGRGDNCLRRIAPEVDRGVIFLQHVMSLCGNLYEEAQVKYKTSSAPATSSAQIRILYWLNYKPAGPVARLNSLHFYQHIF